MRWVLALAAAIACAAPLHAAEAETREEAGKLALRCVVWSSLSADTEDPKIVEAFQLAMTYFVGVAEAHTGKKIDELLTAEFIENEVVDFDALSDDCLPLMQDMGQRLIDLGETLQAAETVSPAG